MTPATITFKATAGGDSKTVTWEVFATPAQPKVKNVIFFLGDGMSVGHRTGARLMSKGMTEGKANGRLNMDDLDRMAFIGTSSTNAIATDSANTMSTYMTGHKTAVNALGVYADRTKNPFDDPKVETIAEALRRLTKKSVDVVTTAEVEDATTYEGEISDLIALEETDPMRRRAALRALSSGERIKNLKELTYVIDAADGKKTAKLKAENADEPKGKKAERQASAEKAAASGVFAVPSPPRLVVNG